MAYSENLPVFVYGTLRPGQKNYPRYLQDRTLRELPAAVRGRLFFMDDGGYPYLTAGEEKVVGELVDIMPEHYDAVLRGLDELEEYDPLDEEHSVYLRRKTEVILEDDERVTAWTYYWNGPGTGRRIGSGDFTRPD